ncbi:piggyBac transposable element-derived protein 4-like [Penaeus japonicus]|uniref:piggyBac transposable element-derived protein 4-like n=1 Tax=Penaeus japonicus TaxID=27405 RepID=UPI001C70CCEB|nr:piggyBac transposable element-derived protein 4-like [Penaeus japonicus]
MTVKVVTVLSTVHRATVEGDGKPHAILDYNVGMKGVDVGDQLSASYPTTRRSRVWYRKVFFLFDLAIVNAFAVHRTLGGRNSQKEFRLKLGKLLIGGYRYGNAPMTRRSTRAFYQASFRQRRGLNDRILSNPPCQGVGFDVACVPVGEYREGPGRGA